MTEVPKITPTLKCIIGLVFYYSPGTFLKSEFIYNYLSMIKITVFLILFIPLGICAQADNGIVFQENLSWKELLHKAKKEKKLIFLNLYASWCVPCKIMEKEVFVSNKVSTLVNNKFISVKVQMDTSSEQYNIKDADIYKNMAVKYNVTGYPAFIFLSSEGNLINKEEGYKPVDAFCDLVMDAFDESKQYTMLLSSFKQGIIDEANLKLLAFQAKKFGESKLAEEVAKKYKKKQFDFLTDSVLMKDDNFEFVREFPQLFSSEDRIFWILFDFMKEPAQRMKERDFSERFIKFVIKRENVTNALYRSGKPIVAIPDWKRIDSSITTKYGSRYSSMILDDSKLEFYKRTADWKMYAFVFEERMKKFPPTAVGKSLHPFGDSWGINVAAWDIFLFCDNKLLLKKALNWIDLAISLDSENCQYLDTKANILYKLKRRKKAIEVERKAIEVDHRFAVKNGKNRGTFFDFYNDIILKMKNRLPTWSIENK